MPLYSEDMLNKLASSGDRHKSILMDMASGTERKVLMHLGQLYEQVATPVQKRWEASLQNTDNRKFFQGYSEAVSAAFMMRAGWSVVDLCDPKQCLIMRHPDGRDADAVRRVDLRWLGGRHVHNHDRQVKQPLQHREHAVRGAEQRRQKAIERWKPRVPRWPCECQPGGGRFHINAGSSDE